MLIYSKWKMEIILKFLYFSDFSPKPEEPCTKGNEERKCCKRQVTICFDLKKKVCLFVF